jgi:outer membrane protein OmpA-like peptidoglycan-associated protein
MRRYWRIGVSLLTVIGLSHILLASAGYAGFGDSLKKKVEKEVEAKAEEATGKATGETEEVVEGQEGEAGGKEPAKAGDSPAGKGGGLSSVSTKFDFVPGDSVMLFDDFTQDELGEFPARWRLAEGTFETAESSGERWLRCTSPDGRVRMKLPAMASLPEFWTLEFDLFLPEPMGTISVRALSEGDRVAWEAAFPHGQDMQFRTGDIFSATPLEGSPAGRHHLMFMARGTGLKAYIDQQRMASVPEISPAGGMPAEIEIRMFSPVKPMITNVRLAEGCRPAKDMLAEGKLVTHGIHFKTGSDVVLPDSAPILRQVASYLQANPAVKLQITGHTDNVGAATNNLDLSKRRAASVAMALTQELAIGADRLATDGKGDTEPMASNGKPEGRAMNRRVEFAKL